jgi:hypothetical protein
MELFNPINCELGDTPKLVIYYYDDETYINDANATQILLNDTYNIKREHPLLIGWTNTFNIYSMHFYNMSKTNGNDLFIVKFLF